MTQIEFQESNAGLSQNEIIAQRLTEKRGEWVSMPDLSAASGSYVVHSRISDLRKKGLQIESRTERHGKKNHSFYKLV
jgi:hypothetical protein